METNRFNNILKITATVATTGEQLATALTAP